MNSRQQSCTDSQGFLLRHSTQENLRTTSSHSRPSAFPSLLSPKPRLPRPSITNSTLFVATHPLRVVYLSAHSCSPGLPPPGSEDRWIPRVLYTPRLVSPSRQQQALPTPHPPAVLLCRPRLLLSLHPDRARRRRLQIDCKVKVYYCISSKHSPLGVGLLRDLPSVS